MRLFPGVISESEASYDGGRVRVLPPEVAHRIAAGEVIQRPASAVKELVENTLDVGATWVEVEIEGGGIRLVRVRDDGSGISAQDARRSVGRHATSKISSAEDLARVLSLGFRGEALHAISSVSALTLTTGQRGALPGTSATRVRLFAGGPAEVSPASHPAGTTVEARDLFLNLPVRRGSWVRSGPRRTPTRTTALRFRAMLTPGGEQEIRLVSQGSIVARRLGVGAREPGQPRAQRSAPYCTGNPGGQPRQPPVPLGSYVARTANAT